MSASVAVCISCQAQHTQDAQFCLQCGEPMLVGRVAGVYRLVAPLGAGGMGAVYRAEHVRLGTPFAVKVLHRRFARDEKVAARFLREAKATSQLQHEHIVFIADYGEFEPFGPYIAMEFLQGQALGDAEGLSLHEIGVIGRQVCDAMMYSHRQGMVHRDLKPDNIFLMQREEGQDPFLKILDFGIAKAMEQESQQLTKTGAVLGTPVYMAPEQGVGETVDHRADIYALATMLFQLMAGRPPFVGESVVDLLSQRMYKEAPDLSAFVPPFAGTQLEVVLSEALRRDPNDRTSTMGQMRVGWMQAFGELGERYSKEELRLPLRVLLGLEPVLPQTAESLPRRPGTVDVPPPSPFQPAQPAMGMENPEPQQRLNAKLPSSEYLEPKPKEPTSPPMQATALPTPAQSFAEMPMQPVASTTHSGPLSPPRTSSPAQPTPPSLQSGGTSGSHYDLEVAGASQGKLILLGGMVVVSLLIVVMLAFPPWGKVAKNSSEPPAPARRLEVRGVPTPPRTQEAKDADDDDSNDDGDDLSRPTPKPSVRRERAVRRRRVIRRVRKRRIQPRPRKRQSTPEPRVVVRRAAPTDGCPANQAGRRWHRLLANEKTLEVRVNGRLVRRSSRASGWCLPVSNSAKVSIDGTAYNLALCEFRIGSATPRQIRVVIKDADDQSPGPYCYKGGK